MPSLISTKSFCLLRLTGVPRSIAATLVAQKAITSALFLITRAPSNWIRATLMPRAIAALRAEPAAIPPGR